jgi:hypothetical protein
MNADEGYYAIAARNVMRGLVPYRDFAYTQMPILPYFNGALMRLLGYRLITQRIVNAMWGGLTLAVILWTVRHRLRRWEPALLSVFVVAASPHFVAMQAIGKSYALAGFFLTLSYSAVYWRGSRKLRLVAFATFGTLAIGCRLNLLLPFMVAALALVLESPRGPRRILMTSGVALVPLVVLSPFVLMAPQQFAFFNWQYHLGSSLNRPSLLRWAEFWQMAPAALLIGFAGLSGATALTRQRCFVPLVLMFGALVGGCIAPLCLKSAYGDYVTPALPLVGASAVIAMWETHTSRPFAFRHVAWLWPGLSLLVPLPSLSTDNGVPGRTADLAEALDPFCLVRKPCFRWPRAGQNISDVSQYLRGRIEEGPILTPLPIVAVETDRETWPRTEMGQFSVYSDTEPGRAKELHLTTQHELTRLIKQRIPQALVILEGRINWNFEWIVPSLRLNSPAIRNEFYSAINDNYSVAYRSGNINVLLPSKVRLNGRPAARSHQ